MKYLIIYNGEETAELSNMEVRDLTPKEFAQFYEESWNFGEAPPTVIPFNTLKRAMKLKPVKGLED